MSQGLTRGPTPMEQSPKGKQTMWGAGALALGIQCSIHPGSAMSLSGSVWPPAQGKKPRSIGWVVSATTTAEVLVSNLPCSSVPTPGSRPRVPLCAGHTHRPVLSLCCAVTVTNGSQPTSMDLILHNRATLAILSIQTSENLRKRPCQQASRGPCVPHW